MKEELQQTLDELGVTPSKGQRFLRSETVPEALAAAAEPEDVHVMDAGAGTGAITGHLVEMASRVTAVEPDPRLARYLREEYPGIEVLEADFLEMEEVEAERVVSNPPFGIAKEMLEKLGSEQVMSAVLVQKEVAEKAIAAPGSSEYSVFSIRTQLDFVPVKLRDVSPESFYPEPEVEASILKLYPKRGRRGVEDPDRLVEVASALFTQRRKKVRNSFVDSRHILGFEKDRAKKFRDELPHSEKRVRDLKIEEFEEIAGAIKEL